MQTVRKFMRPSKARSAAASKAVAKAVDSAKDQEARRELEALNDDANREMLGSDADYFCLGNIGNK